MYQEGMNNFPVTGKRILRFWELWDSENDQFETLSPGKISVSFHVI
jgi:hypothetical protein